MRLSYHNKVVEIESKLKRDMESSRAKEIAYTLRGCSFEIYNEYKWGFSEAVYEAALELLMSDTNYKVGRQQPLPCFFKGRRTKQDYRMDLVIDGDFIVELKSVSHILPEHRAQLYNYCNLFQKNHCMLINFGLDGVQSEWYYYHLDTKKIDLL